MKYLFLFFIVFSSIHLYGQDTIYSYPYPKGIITESVKKVFYGYIFVPINNPNLKIVINKSETINIKYNTGEEYTNKSYKGKKNIVLSTNPETGKIYYSDIINFKGADIKELYNEIKRMPQNLVRYKLISSDDKEYSSQNYVGSFSAKFAGDSYILYFNLSIKFKDEKIKYEYTDFVATLIKGKTKQDMNPFATGVISTISEYSKTLEQMYGSDNRNTDKKGFWIVIDQNINNSINSLKTMGEKAMPGNKDNDW